MKIYPKWSLFSERVTFSRPGGGGAYIMWDKTTYAGTWAKNAGGGQRNCGILRYMYMYEAIWWPLPGSAHFRFSTVNWAYRLLAKGEALGTTW